MPWREATPMDAKVEFIRARQRAEESMTASCERAGISRQCGYELWHRFQREGWSALRSARGRRSGCRGRSPRRRARQSWRCAINGPTGDRRKLRAKLCEQAPQQQWPAHSTIGDLLKRAGRIRPRRRRAHAQPTALPLMAAVKPNVVWCIDFKGWWHTLDGARCNPLTVTDAYSRFLLCSELLAQADYEHSRPVLERMFREAGFTRVEIQAPGRSGFLVRAHRE